MAQQMAFHCATAALNKLEDDIVHQCHFGRALMLIFGPPGCGRTHLAERLRAQLSRSLPTAFVEAHPLLSHEQLDADALTQLGLHQLAAGHLDLKVAVQRAPAGRRVLIIDNAHDLHLSILRTLVTTAAAEREREDPRLLVILFGDDMLEAALAEFEFGGLGENDLHRLTIPAMSVDDAQRMAVAWTAAQGVPELDKSRVRDLFQRAQALPGPFLEALAMQYDNHEREQDEQFEESSPSRDDALVSDVRTQDDEPARSQSWLMTPLIVLGVLVLALLMLYQAEISAWISGKPAANTGAQHVEPRTEIAIAPENVPVTSEPAVSGDAGIEVITSQAGNTTTVEPLPSDPQPSMSVAPEATTGNGTAAITPLNTVATTPESKPDVKSESPVVSKPVVKKDVEKIDNKPKATERVADFSSDENALLAMNAKHYVVQIIALSDEKSIKQFESQYGLKKARYYRATRNGRTMYFLVLPEYADHAAAEKARDALPEAVRKQKPWIKQLGVIQQEIRARAKAR